MKLQNISLHHLGLALFESVHKEDENLENDWANYLSVKFSLSFRCVGRHLPEISALLLRAGVPVSVWIQL